MPRLAAILAMHWLDASSIFVDYVGTAKRFRRRGIARRLLTRTGASRVFLMVRSWSAAHRAYERMGFVVVPRAGTYEPALSEVCLRLDIAHPIDDGGSVAMGELPWADARALLRECGLGAKGVRWLLQTDDAHVLYRTVAAEDVVGGHSGRASRLEEQADDPPSTRAADGAARGDVAR